MSLWVKNLALGVLVLLALSPLCLSQPISPHDLDIRPPQTLPPELEEEAAKKQPWPIRWMIQPLKRGMFIRLPIMDTDPNRGVTFGVMPIWVLKAPGEDRIRHIHAPSLTYNKIFKVIPTYRYYYYPTTLSSLIFRAAISKTVDRELLTEYEDLDFLGKDIALSGKFQINADGSERFFGIGPATSVKDEANYTRKTIQYFAKLGLPLFRESNWKFNVGHHLAGEKIAPGVVEALPDIQAKFPAHAPVHTHQDAELHLFVDYDTRDNPVTTMGGSYAKFALESSQRTFGSEFTFQNYTVDLRHFIPHKDTPFTTATRVRFEQLVGTAPFYLMPQLGGKNIHRAYGRGRYVDKGLLTAGLEERITVYKIAMAGVVTEFEVAPFVDIGTVFSTPGALSRKHVRPAFGGAVRAIARPQVVGSIDFGVGQEGLTVFMDINYPF